MTTGRTVLGIMGLGTVPPITAEDVTQDILASGGNPSGWRFGPPDSKKFSEALRRLADDIEAKGTFVESFELKTSAVPDEFLKHTLTIKFTMNENEQRNG